MTATSAPADVRTWNHNRKGRISGVVVDETDEWLTIVLVDTGPVPAGGYDVTDGERLTFRKSLATEVQ